jgi:hypothetical protein
VPRRQRDGSLRPYSGLSKSEQLLFLFQVAPQLYSRGCVDPVAGPLLLRKSGSAGNRTRSSGSVARNSDHRGGPNTVTASVKIKKERQFSYSLNKLQ